MQPLHLRLAERRIAVIGANGSGKSTLLRVIAGLSEPTHGQVLFDPRSPKIGFIFANPQAQMIMPVVGEDIEFSLKQRGIPAGQRRKLAHTILEEVGLADRIDSSVYELSSGEQQKVALAGVLAAEPQLVLADEPTTLLDLASATEFQAKLLDLGVPLIWATHDLDFAAQADRVLVFDAGELVADAEPAPAVRYYRRLVGSAKY